MKAREIHFAVIPMPIKDKGDVYMFWALDRQTDFLFNLGIEEVGHDGMVIQKVEQFMNNKDFTKLKNAPFILVVPFADSKTKRAILEIIEPCNGSLLIDKELNVSVIMPVFQKFLERQSEG